MAFSDDFTGATLDPRWTVDDRVGDCTVDVDSSNLRISLPAGSNHDSWGASREGCYVTQSHPNEDFTLEILINSDTPLVSQGVGIWIENADGSRWMRNELTNLVGGRTAFAAGTTSGSSSTLRSVAYGYSMPIWFRLVRLGDTWQMFRSSDRVSWSSFSSAYSFALVVAKVGVYAYNYNSTEANAPAFTALVDRFETTSLPEEDPEGAAEDQILVSDSVVGSISQAVGTTLDLEYTITKTVGLHSLYPGEDTYPGDDVYPAEGDLVLRYDIAAGEPGSDIDGEASDSILLDDGAIGLGELSSSGVDTLSISDGAAGTIALIPQGYWSLYDDFNRAPDPTPPDPELTPPARANTVNNAAPGTTVVTNTHYANPQGALVFPDEIEHVTVTGAKTMPTICAGWQDVWVQGTSDAWINSGPRTDGGDLLQIKGGPGGGQLPADITIRYWYGHDVDRSGNPEGHPDGVQIMGGSRITFVDCLMERVAVQPFFAKPEGPAAGGGVIEDILFLRCSSDSQGAEGYYAFRIAQTASGTAPWRVRIVDCSGDRGVGMDANAISQGGEIINWTYL